MLVFFDQSAVLAVEQRLTAYSYYLAEPDTEKGETGLL